jgi:hypothetical protein
MSDWVLQQPTDAPAPAGYAAAMYQHRVSLALATVGLIGACTDVGPGERSIHDGVTGTELATNIVGPEQTAPAAHEDPFIAALDHVQFFAEDNSIEIQACAVDGTIIGSLVVVAGNHGETTVAASFDDGAVEVQLAGSTVSFIDSDLPYDVVVRRADALMLEIRASTPTAYEGWGMCAAKTIGAVAVCAGPSLVLCGTGAFYAACDCLVQLAKAKKWVHDEC